VRIPCAFFGARFVQRPTVSVPWDLVITYVSFCIAYIFITIYFHISFPSFLRFCLVHMGSYGISFMATPKPKPPFLLLLLKIRPEGVSFGAYASTPRDLQPCLESFGLNELRMLRSMDTISSCKTKDRWSPHRLLEEAFNIQTRSLCRLGLLRARARKSTHRRSTFHFFF
jgi:hypothetical protein